MAPTSRTPTARDIHAPLPFTAELFAPFGHVLSNPGSNAPHLTVNASTARKHPAVSTVNHSYPATSPPATVNLNLFVCQPRPLTNGIFNLEIVERHPYTSQSFIPLDRDAEYIVAVAPTAADGGPDLEGLRTFRVPGGGVGVTYGKGVWHAPMIVVSGRGEGGGVEFIVVNAENGTTEDLDECAIVGGLGVRVRTVGLWEKAKL